MSVKEKIATWYNDLLWTAEMVAKAVVQRIITTKDYEEITGKKYEESKDGN